MGYDRNDPWLNCGERDDRAVTEEALARTLYEAEYDGEAYPWETQSAEEHLTYIHQARKVLRDYIVLSA